MTAARTTLASAERTSKTAQDWAVSLDRRARAGAPERACCLNRRTNARTTGRHHPGAADQRPRQARPFRPSVRGAPANRLPLGDRLETEAEAARHGTPAAAKGLTAASQGRPAV